jgi:L-threonylcarbamoyladenylate synthase
LAVAALARGELVVMPTETVYGLAGNALDVEAVRRIFAAKGRPAENPLIVHVASVEGARGITADWPSEAQLLAEKFWPGPLTMVLPKAAVVPDSVTAGKGTVAVRVPSHPVALELLREVGMPLAAPSANRFTELSPTRSEDVDPAIAGAAFCVLDGGPCDVGIESAIVDLSAAFPILLRPGVLGRTELEAVVGPLGEPSGGVRAPGMYPRHYAPATPVRLAVGLAESEAGITFGEPGNVNQVLLSSDPAEYAARLYATLRDLDGRGLDEIVIELPPQTPEWEAVLNRLSKAAF